MAITSQMEQAFNEQINLEFYSSYLYVSMSFQSEEFRLRGFANWFRVQAQEELAHGLGLADYITERGGRVEVSNLPGPPSHWETVLGMFKEVCVHESVVTSRINDLVSQAYKLNDYASVEFLNWYISEQVEEESSAADTLGKLELADGNPSAILIIDQQLGTREFIQPKIR